MTAFPMLARCFARQWAGLEDVERRLAGAFEDPTYLRYDHEEVTALWVVETPEGYRVPCITVKAL